METDKVLNNVIKVKCGEEVEYTGFVDVNGNEIYVGDILREVSLREV